jgi:hypothetical protein
MDQPPQPTKTALDEAALIVALAHKPNGVMTIKKSQT